MGGKISFEGRLGKVSRAMCALFVGRHKVYARNERHTLTPLPRVGNNNNRQHKGEEDE